MKTIALALASLLTLSFTAHAEDITKCPIPSGDDTDIVEFIKDNGYTVSYAGQGQMVPPKGKWTLGSILINPAYGSLYCRYEHPNWHLVLGEKKDLKSCKILQPKNSWSTFGGNKKECTHDCNFTCTE